MSEVKSSSGSSGAIKIGSGSNIILGLWLIASLWIVGYASTGVLWNNAIVGAVLIVTGWMRLSARPNAAMPSWASVVIGVWLIFAPSALELAPEEQRWSSIIVGILVVIFAITGGGTRATRES
jgi:hypothetical protein